MTREQQIEAALIKLRLEALCVVGFAQAWQPLSVGDIADLRRAADEATTALATPPASPDNDAASPVCEWQDISTAPKDGTRIDILAKAWLPAFDRFEFWRFPDAYWREGVSMSDKSEWRNVDRDWRPVAWMPIPPLSLPTPEAT